MFLFIILYFLKCFSYATLFDSFHYSLLIFSDSYIFKKRNKSDKCWTFLDMILFTAPFVQSITHICLLPPLIYPCLDIIYLVNKQQITQTVYKIWFITATSWNIMVYILFSNSSSNWECFHTCCHRIRISFYDTILPKVFKS